MKKICHIIRRSLIIFFIPLVITYFLSGSQLIKTETSEKGFDIQIKGVTGVIKEWDGVVRSSLQNILKLDVEKLGLKYEVCFVNKGSGTVYPDGEFIPADSWVLFDNKYNLTIPFRGEKCIIQEPNKRFNYKWSFIFHMKITKDMVITKPEEINQKSINFHFDTDSYSKMEFKSMCLLFFTILIAWFGFVLLLIKIYKFIVYGYRSV